MLGRGVSLKSPFVAAVIAALPLAGIAAGNATSRPQFLSPLVIEGKVLSVYSQEASELNRRTNTFRVTRYPEGDWLIELVPIQNMKSPTAGLLVGMEYLHDGVDSFTRLRFNPEFMVDEIGSFTNGKATLTRLPEAVPVRTPAELIALEGAVPGSGHQELRAVWISHAFSTLLSADERRLSARPFMHLGRAYELAPELPVYFTELSGSGGVFFDQIYQVHPAFFYRLDERSRLIRTKTTRGYTNVSFTVSASTNVGGITVPTKSQLISRSRSRPEIEPDFVSTYSIETTNIRLAEANIPTFQPIPRTVITEKRSRMTDLRGVFSYVSQEGFPLEERNLEELPELHLTRRAEASASMPSHSGNSRLVFVFLLVLIPSFLTIFWIKKH